MREPASNAEPVGAFKPPSLADLRALPLPERCATVLRCGEDDLAATLRSLGAEGAASCAAMGAERLAWAVAFNVEGAPNSEADGAASRRRIRGYCDRWPSDTGWTEIWCALVRQPDPPDSAATLLGELALSVACERRDDWQHPSSRPIDPSQADRAFEFVYARHKLKVTGDVFKNFGTRAGNPEAIAGEAWSRVFCDYWSCQARRRFLGLCRVSTFVCQVARYVALDALREQAGIGEGDEAFADRPGLASPLPEELRSLADPAANLMAEELDRRVRECTSCLPVKQRIVAEMVWFREISAKRAAEILRVSEAAISQHLKKARGAVRGCLRGQGIDLSGRA